MQIRYIPGDSLAFVTFIKQKGIGTKATLENIDGHFRWVIKEDDGTQYIARPSETEPK